MLRKTGKIMMVLCALVLVISVVVVSGCKDNSLKGKTIIYASWFSNWHVDTFEPRNEGETRQLEWRRKIQEDYGFQIWEEEIGGWGEYFQLVTNNILSGDKTYSAYQLPADWAITLYRQGLLAELPKDKIAIDGQWPVEMEKTAYDPMMARLFTFGGKQYAITYGEGNSSWQSIKILYNKRLLREAGIDPELPYDLQARGEWTWDAFYDMARRTTRDINNDGITDIYATNADENGKLFQALLYANNGNIVKFNDDGTAYLTLNTPEFLEALNFYWQLKEQGYAKTRPEGSGWAWEFYQFVDGQIAFFCGDEWFKGMATDMQDEYGSVVAPKGPRATDYRVSVTENVTVIPAIFSPEEVEDILLALDLWRRPVDVDWQGGHYHAYRDRRAVDETVALTKDPDGRYITYRNYAMVPFLGGVFSEFTHELYEFNGNPSQLVESWMPEFQSVIDEFNSGEFLDYY